MSWKKLQAEGKVHAHRASKREVDDLRAVILRDLEDAEIRELSDDRRFATAYNAALQTAKMSILCAGYRLAGTQGHHRLTFEAARLALGVTAGRTLDFFEACRRKRNVIDYDHASVATHTEAEEIVKEAKEFLELVERWIVTNKPKFAPRSRPCGESCFRPFCTEWNLNPHP